MAKGKDAETAGPGPGVDAQGRAVIDPTANVIAILEAAVNRQDDLRIQESQHVRELMELRQSFYEQLRIKESDRIDAIRAVDVGAVNRAAEVSAAQAQTLATQVATSAETLRAQVQATATAGTVALAAALEPIQKDVQDLRRIQYEQQGQKAGVVETRDDRRQGISVVWVALGVGVSLLSTLIAAGALVYVVVHG